MKKIILFYVFLMLAVALCFTASCDKIQWRERDKYEINKIFEYREFDLYAEDLVRTSIEFYDWTESEMIHYDPKPESKKEDFEGEFHELEYFLTMRLGDIYYSDYRDNNGHSCIYNEAENRCVVLGFPMENLPTNMFTSEEQCMMWIKNKLAEFGVTNLSDYEYSRKTTYSGNGFSREFDYFCPAIIRDDIVTMYYEFCFEKKISGYDTRDFYRVKIPYSRFDNDTISISFPFVFPNSYSKFGEIEIDRDHIDNAVKEYIRSTSNTEKYNVGTISIRESYLVPIADKLCCVYYVNMEFMPIDGDLERTIKGERVCVVELRN